MGNKLCKEKSEISENPKSSTPFNRIINRLHLRPSSWKSDSHLNQKQTNRTKEKLKDSNTHQENLKNKHLSKSSDWTSADLEVPEKDNPIHLPNPKLSFIFDNSESTPVPPPRKHKKGTLREKIEAVAKTGLQAFQPKKPVEEPLFVKKTVNQTCPVDEHDCAIHNRNHKHENRTHELSKREAKTNEAEKKSDKRRKNLSVVSLPNYNELKLTTAVSFDDLDRKKEEEKHSLTSLPNEEKKLTVSPSKKLENCMTRCRSFGSLLPQHLLGKLKVRKAPMDIESDDSFGGLEDWDLGLIEHYNPTNKSLPRQVKVQRNREEVLSGIEGLVVGEEDDEKPKAPTRRSESLLKKINREASESAKEQRSQNENCARCKSVTPPPTPEQRQEERVSFGNATELPTKENGQVEHSSLMKILQEFSIRDKQEALKTQEGAAAEKSGSIKCEDSEKLNNAELQKAIHSVEDFLKMEKSFVDTDRAYGENKEMIRS